MIDLKKLQHNDPLKRVVEKQSEQAEFSPMDPPNPYSPPTTDSVPYEQMPAFLQELIDEHQAFLNKLDSLEEILAELQQNETKVNREMNRRLSQFFSFLDDQIVTHQLKEEKILFPVLQKRLLNNGEHGQGLSPKTAVDMLEDDHIKMMQLAAVTFNFLGLVSRIPEHTSRAMVLDAAIEQGKALVEHLRLHIFRENNVAFGLAHIYINESEFEEMQQRRAKYR